MTTRNTNAQRTFSHSGFKESLDRRKKTKEDACSFFLLSAQI